MFNYKKIKMTALQNIIKEAKSLKTKYPKRYSKWTDYVKQASAIYAAKHKGKSEIGKKKAVKKTIGKKPTEKVILKKVHAVKQVSKNLYNQLNKLDKAQNKHMIGALPIGFKGSILDVNFKVINQFDIYNNVNCIVENLKNGDLITTINGNSTKVNESEFINYIKYYTKDLSELPNQVRIRINKFFSGLNKEVKEYNSGNKVTVKKQPLLIKKLVKKSAKKVVNDKNTLTKIKNALRQDHKRLKGGYVMTKGKVRIGSVKINVAEKVKHDLHKLQLLERELMQLEKMRNDPRLKDIKGTLFLEIKILKSVIKEQKTHIKELKKHI